MKIGTRQQEVLSILARGYTTQRNIARRLKISQPAVSKIIKKLQNKGLINPLKQGVIKGGGYLKGEGGGYGVLVHPIRLHNLHFHVRVLYTSDRFCRFSQRVFKLDGNTVVLDRDSLEVYVTKNFYGCDVDAVTQEGLDYFFVLLGRLENRLNVVLFKDQSHNVRLVRRHYAECFNEFARECEDKGEKLRVKCEDGRLWLVIDYSKPDGVNLEECEAIHPVSSKDDMALVQRDFNALRERNLSRDFLASAIEDLIKDRAYHAENMRTHVQAIRDLGDGVSELVRVIKEFKGV